MMPLTTAEKISARAPGMNLNRTSEGQGELTSSSGASISQVDS
jgi:hypothetical protein